MKKQDKQKLQKKYDNLSLVERNAYEQIVDRRDDRLLGLPYILFRILVDIGIFLIISAIMLGIPFELLSGVYSELLVIVFSCVITSIILIIISVPIKVYRLNKLKRKLLSE